MSEVTAVADAGAMRPLPWQANAWTRLQHLIEEARSPHALLLEGLVGTGRNRFANALALRLLCAHPQATGHCGECRSCELAAAGAHADFLRLSPEDDGKSIGIEAIREAIAFAGRTAALGAHKVILISPAELLTTPAFNAFLKCLEEPSPGTTIVLVLARGYPIPATIRSRCQRWQLPVPDAQAAANCLQRELLASTAEQAVADSDIERALQLHPRQPLAALGLLLADDAREQLALASVLHEQRGAGAGHLPQVEHAAQQVAAEPLLALLEREVQAWLRQRNASELRSPRAHAALRALRVYDELRKACRAGTNPNLELLRFRALRAYAGLWEQ